MGWFALILLAVAAALFVQAFRLDGLPTSADERLGSIIFVALGAVCVVLALVFWAFWVSLR